MSLRREEITEDLLVATRREWIDADLAANEAETAARRLRRTATAKQRMYDDLVAIYQGQLTIEEA